MEPVGDRRGSGDVSDVIDKNGELVTPEPRKRVVLTYLTAQYLGELA